MVVGRTGDEPSVAVAPLVACGDDGPSGLRAIARQLFAAASWLEGEQRRLEQLEAARRRVAELEAMACAR